MLDSRSDETGGKSMVKDWKDQTLENWQYSEFDITCVNQVRSILQTVSLDMHKISITIHKISRGAKEKYPHFIS